MALDVLEVLMGVLCQRDTLYQCQQFVQEYPDVVTQTIYFFFFPTVFMIVFVYLLAASVAGDDKVAKKFKAMIGVAIFVFIVLQGWYHIILILSKFWFFSIIIMGGYYVFVYKMGVKKGEPQSGTKGTAGRAFDSLANYAGRRISSAIRGDEKTIISRIERLQKEVVSYEKTIDSYEHAQDKYAAASMRAAKHERLNEIDMLMRELGQMTSFGGTDVGKSSKLKGYKHWLNEHAKN
jgi:hypothetical protein